MSTMIRLTSAESTDMVELIVIREEADSLVLHLRQFSPALELRLTQDMPLAAITADSVTFKAPDGSAIPFLAYRRIDDEQMEVDVTVAGGQVLTAQLERR